MNKMKNPMTPDEQCKAVMDNAAGYDMQRRLLSRINDNAAWQDRMSNEAGNPLNFQDWEYRRTPEQLVRYVIADPDGKTWVRKTLCEVVGLRNNQPGFTIHRLVEDPNWTEPKPAMPVINPWLRI